MSRKFKKVMTAVVVLIGGGILLWGASTAALYAAMRQPPERFGAIMKHVPGMAMMVLPFRPLHVISRDGRIRYKSAPGPFGFSTRELEQALKRTLTVS